MNIQEQYFKALYSDFAAKVEILSQLIKEHPGEKGRFLEKTIVDLLTTFLPTKYSLGSGFVIDSLGGRSRQCDIVIYDASSLASVFSHGGHFFFPVESVYAVIEIKMTLDNRTAKDACDNIAKVKQLVSKAQPAMEWVIAEDESLEYRQYPSQSPLGFIMAYQSNTNQMQTIRKWFDEAYKTTGDKYIQPDIAISIIEGFKARSGRLHTSDVPEFKHYQLPLRDAEGNFVEDENKIMQGLRFAEQTADGFCYVPELNGFNYSMRCKQCVHPHYGLVLADAPRLLLTTLGTIEHLLALRRLTDSAFNAYLPIHYSASIRI